MRTSIEIALNLSRNVFWGLMAQPKFVGAIFPKTKWGVTSKQRHLIYV
jgi:hypothetical protein